MSKREVIAYAISHAPPGVKGGPYEALLGPLGTSCPSLGGACRGSHACAEGHAADLRERGCSARVIRIVRKARPSPSEASAVEVLREYVRWVDNVMGGRSIHLIQHDMRAVLAASGPDPSEVVRAALKWERACRRSAARALNLELAMLAAVDAYRRAGGE